MLVIKADRADGGGYIKASQKAYDLLITEGYKRENHNNKLQKYIVIDNDTITYVVKEFLNSFPHKQFYINNGALSWDEPKGWGDKIEWTEPPILKDTEPTSANNAQDEPTTSKMEKVEDVELTHGEAKKPIHGIDELSIVGDGKEHLTAVEFEIKYTDPKGRVKTIKQPIYYEMLFNITIENVVYKIRRDKA